MVDRAPKERATDGNERTQKAGAWPTLETHEQFQNECTGYPRQQKPRQVAPPGELSASTPLGRDISQYGERSQIFKQAKIDRHILQYNLICDAKDGMPRAYRPKRRPKRSKDQV